MLAFKLSENVQQSLFFKKINKQIQMKMLNSLIGAFSHVYDIVHGYSFFIATLVFVGNILRIKLLALGIL